MRIEIATLFPDMCETVLSESIIGRARRAGKLDIHCRNIRDYTLDKHRPGGRHSLWRRQGNAHAGRAHLSLL